MNQPDHISKFFDDITQSMLLKFRGWEQDLPHEGEKGGVRERRVTDFLKSMLPNCFGVGSGHIIDKQGNTSGQIDIVIYNALDGIRIPIDEYYSLFPVECVHAAIEVKSTLTASSGAKPRGSINECIEAVSKFKSLITDNQKIPNDLPCIVFAYQSDWKEDVKKVMNWFHRFGEDKYIPDITFILDPGLLLCNYGKETVYTHLYRKAPLLKFLDELISRMERVPISSPDLWNDYIKWGSDEITASLFLYTDGKLTKQK